MGATSPPAGDELEGAKRQVAAILARIADPAEQTRCSRWFAAELTGWGERRIAATEGRSAEYLAGFEAGYEACYRDCGHAATPARANSR